MVALTLNPLRATIKPHSNGPLYSNTIVGTLAVDRRAVIWYNDEEHGRAGR